LRGIDVARIAEDVPESHAREMLTVCGGAGAWESNVWRSPTRNIACKYRPFLVGVTCQTENDGWALTVERNGRAYRDRDYVLNVPYGVPIRRYGRTWESRNGVFRCVSGVKGMTCRSGRHGFWINRTHYRMW